MRPITKYVDDTMDIIDEDDRTLLDIMEEEGGCFCLYHLSETHKTQVKELEDSGLIIRCDKIPHHKLMINPSYTYVTNDDAGHKLAKTTALYTMVLS